MPILFKCKMCGGTIEFEEGATVGVCEYCGTKQTLPRLDSDRRANLYDRANHFRRNNEFDKAAGFYEQILSDDATDAEAYWSQVLCRYGIEYVEDPVTHRRIPTINRTQYTSIFDDENYRLALKYADGAQRVVYEEEASAINEIQKGILAISQGEEPYEVFLCYKETDDSGRRTPDSVLANDIYHQLTQEGFKVFFSRITLEDKLGTAYEPYIFAALNSAKVMVVIGTKPEYFNAVWVKNEWSRYLSIVNQSGGKKVLIPAYRDMDPYDLPDEFSHLQAQDMSKLGFMQDLIRGIKKILKSEKTRTPSGETVIVNAGVASIEPLLRRAYMFLEDREWDRADEYCEQVLNMDPENAKAYLGKLMAELQVVKQEDLLNCDLPFDDRSNYQKAVRFGDAELVSALEGYIDQINDRNEKARISTIYRNGKNAMDSADNETAYRDAAEILKTISGYQDVDELAERCLELAEECRKERIYQSAMSKVTGGKVADYEEAISLFRTISGWKDAEQQIHECQRKIEAIKAEEKIRDAERAKAKEQSKKRMKIIVPVLFVCVIGVLLYMNVLAPKLKYDRAIRAIESEDYITAYEILSDLNYKDSNEKRNSIIPQYRRSLLAVADVGSTVWFGTYEKFDNASGGKEDIKWIVLDKKDNRVLVISKYALDCQPYHSVNEAVTWETCSLRKWLNSTFLTEAFTPDEQSRIIQTTVKNEGEADTEDKVFILSHSEAERYFETDDDRVCYPTNYAVAKGLHRAADNGGCVWWLRSLGQDSDQAAVVSYKGRIGNVSESSDLSTGVRPALWIENDEN